MRERKREGERERGKGMAEYDICTYIGKLTGRETEREREILFLV